MAATPKKSLKNRKKTAMVFVHGMGNQAPLQTLRGFVDAVWWQEPLIPGGKPREFWVKPDTVTGDYELRRITTNPDANDRRIDFFEFYWAHLMEGTRLSSVLWWLKRLFWRSPKRVPRRVFSAWIGIGIASLLTLGALLFIVGAFLTALRRLPESFGEAVVWVVLAAIVAAGLWSLRHRVLVQVVGDAARYLTPDPENINARSRIRQSGVSLLKKLNDNPDYDRVIVVGHSLGTVVAYDMLTLAWSDNVKVLSMGNKNSLGALKILEESAEKLRDGPTDYTLDDFRAKQKSFAATLLSRECKGWKVTDFVTMGSPLAHASFLLVDDNTELTGAEAERLQNSQIAVWLSKNLDQNEQKIARVFSARVAERTFPVSPPLPDKPNSASMTYEISQHGRKTTFPHHATVFAAVRWTNLFAPARNLLWGDVISGPVADLFGPGVRDIKLKGKMAESYIGHVNYWNVNEFADDQQHLVALRSALAISEP